MGIVDLSLKRELKGISTLHLEKATNKKNISTSRSFDKNYSIIERLIELVTTFATSYVDK